MEELCFGVSTTYDGGSGNLPEPEVYVRTSLNDSYWDNTGGMFVLSQASGDPSLTCHPG